MSITTNSLKYSNEINQLLVTGAINSNDDLVIVPRQLIKLLGFNSSLLLQYLHTTSQNAGVTTSQSQELWIKISPYDVTREFPYLTLGGINKALKCLLDFQVLSRHHEKKLRDYFCINYPQVKSLASFQYIPEL